jgi:hypothetical protein
MAAPSGNCEPGVALNTSAFHIFIVQIHRVSGIIMPADAAIHIFAAAAIESPRELTLDDINPKTYMDHSKYKGPTKVDRAF